MSVLSTTTKAKLGTTAVKGAVKNPQLVRTAARATLATKAAKGVVKNPQVLRRGAQATSPLIKVYVLARAPLARRQARRSVGSLTDSIGSLSESLVHAGEALVAYGPSAAQELGLVEAPRPKRTLPRVALGFALGAGAMYVLEPSQKERRQKLTSIAGRGESGG